MPIIGIQYLILYIIASAKINVFSLLKKKNVVFFIL